MFFNDFIVWVINSGLSQRAKDEILAVDIDDPENYVAHVRRLLNILKTATVSTYFWPGYYADLEEKYIKLGSAEFLASIPTTLIANKAEPRKTKALNDVYAILADPARLNAAIRGRECEVFTLPAEYEQQDDYLGFVLKDFNRDDKQNNDAYGRIIQCLKDAFTPEELAESGYDALMKVGAINRELRLAVLMESVLYEIEGVLSVEDKITETQIQDLPERFKPQSKERHYFEDVIVPKLIKNLRKTQVPISTGGVLKGRLKELNEVLSASLQGYTSIHDYFRKNVLDALSDFETTNFYLSEPGSGTLKTRNNSITYAICYAMGQQALPAAERTLNLDDVQRGQTYIPSLDSPIHTVDHRMLAVEEHMQENKSLVEFYRGLKKVEQVIFCGVVWGIKQDIQEMFNPVRIFIEQSMSGDEDKMREELKKRVFDKADRIYLQVLNTLTPDDIKQAFKAAVDTRPEFNGFVNALTDLEMLPVKDKLQADMKQKYIEIIKKMKDEKIDRDLDPTKAEIESGYKELAARCDLLITSMNSPRCIEFMKAFSDLENLPVYSSVQEMMKSEYFEILTRMRDEYLMEKNDSAALESGFEELAARCARFTDNIIQQREKDLINAVNDILNTTLKLRDIARRKPVAFLINEEEMRAKFLIILKEVLTIISGVYPPGTKEDGDVLLECFIDVVSKSEAKYSNLISDKDLYSLFTGDEFYRAFFNPVRKDVAALRASGKALTTQQAAKEEEMRELVDSGSASQYGYTVLMASLMRLHVAWLWQSTKGELNIDNIKVLDAANMYGYVLGILTDDFARIIDAATSKEEKTARHDELNARLNVIRKKADALSNSEESDKQAWVDLAKELHAMQIAIDAQYGVTNEAVVPKVDKAPDDSKGKEEANVEGQEEVQEEVPEDDQDEAAAPDAAQVPDVDIADGGVNIQPKPAMELVIDFDLNDTHFSETSHDFTSTTSEIDDVAAAKERKEKAREVKHPGMMRCPESRPIAVSAGGTIVGMCEVVGNHRATQEDALIALRMSGFRQLDNNQQKSILKNTVAKMQANNGLDRMSSTLAGTIAWLDGNTLKTQTVSVGDSLSFLIVLDADNKFDSRKSRLLSTVHNSDNQQERERVAAVLESNPFYESKGQQHVLSVTRAIGDNLSEKKGLGLIHDPDIESYKLNLDKGERAMIVVASAPLAQGLNGHGVAAELSLRDIGQLIETNHGARPDDIAAKLVTAAGSNSVQIGGVERIKYATEENISVAVMSVDSDIPVGAFVFDGRGGDLVSDALAKNFYPELKNSVDVFLNLSTSCDEYMIHLGRDICAAIRDDDFELCKQLIDRPRPESRPRFYVGEITNPSPENAARVARLRQNNESLDLAIKKFVAVREMKEALYSDLPMAERLSEFARVFKANRSLIEQRRDSGAVTFLKVITTALLGLGFLVGLWNVKGRQFSSKVAEQLPVDNKTTGHKPK